MNRRHTPKEPVRRGLPPALFARIVQAVPLSQAAVRYGLAPDRRGWCRCPFHSEKTPSFRIYPGAGGFYCFGCGAGGDVITFVQKLFGLSPVEAAKRLDADFSLGLFDSPTPPDNGWRQRLAQRRQAEEQRERRAWGLVLLLRPLHRLPPPPDTPPEVYAQLKALEEYLEYAKHAQDRQPQKEAVPD